MQRSQVSIAVMAKAPIPGVAKTRLGQDIGYPAAAALYRAFLLDTLAMLDQSIGLLVRSSDVASRRIVCPDHRHAGLLDAIVPRSWSTLPQKRAGLLGGIADVCEAGFADGADVVVVSDADSPAVSADFVVSCLELAENRDVVLGPTHDGGYYLIAVTRGARPQLSPLLLEVAYESATICAATIVQAHRLGLSSGIGPLAFDVDTLSDLRQLRASLVDEPPYRLVATRAALRLVGDLFPTPGRLESLHEPVSEPGS